MDGQTAAAVLGVAPGADRSEIARAFRARAKLVHPDLAGSDDDFITLRSAYELLSATAPLPPERPPSSGERPHGSPWFRPTPSATVDVVDSQRRPRRRLSSLHPDRHRPRWLDTSQGQPGHGGPARRVDPPRDRAGLTFEDHLRGALNDD